MNGSDTEFTDDTETQLANDTQDTLSATPETSIHIIINNKESKSPK